MSKAQTKMIKSAPAVQAPAPAAAPEAPWGTAERIAITVESVEKMMPTAQQAQAVMGGEAMADTEAAAVALLADLVALNPLGATAKMAYVSQRDGKVVVLGHGWFIRGIAQQMLTTAHYAAQAFQRDLDRFRDIQRKMEEAREADASGVDGTENDLELAAGRLQDSTRQAWTYGAALRFWAQRAAELTNGEPITGSVKAPGGPARKVAPGVAATMKAVFG